MTRPKLVSDALAALVAPDVLERIAALDPRYNIAPSQPVLVLPNTADRQVDHYRWGLIPSWASDEKIGYRTINARAESVASKPAFRSAFLKRRCLVLADGFYEWRAEGKRSKTPFFIRRPDGELLAFAGLWEIWRPEDRDEVRSCTIVTTAANELLAPIHDRMPVVLPPQHFEQWLDPDPQPKAQLLQLLLPLPANELTAFPVSKAVNDVNNDGPECVAPAQEQQPSQRQGMKQQKLFG
jgi:putative SOS response-associated peptidase YedK